MFFSAGKNSRWILTSTVLAVFSIMAGCGDETVSSVAAALDGEPAPTIENRPMSSYSGPGSNWQYHLNNDGSFEITRSPVVGAASDLVITGDFATTAAGFLQMTVIASSGIDAPAAETSLWALEIPDYALFLSPASTSDDRMIPMIQGGECITNDLANNWINVRARPSDDATAAQGSYFGTFGFTNSVGTSDLNAQYALSAGFPDQGTTTLEPGFCNDGVMRTATSDIYFSSTGALMAHAFAADEDGGFLLLSLPRKTIGSITDYDGSYVGVLSDSGAISGQNVLPVAVTCAAGVCSGDVVADVATGATAGQPFTADLFGTINEPASGFATGQFSMDGGTGSIACMVDNDVQGTGQRMISCTGQSPIRGYEMLNLILASTN